MERSVKEAFEIYINDKMEQLVLSKPAEKRSEEVSKETTPLSKVKIRPVLLRGELVYQAAEFRGTKVFHKNYTLEELFLQLEQWLNGTFLQAELFSETVHITVLVSRKGKTTVKFKHSQKNMEFIKDNAKETEISDHESRLSHNRVKTYLIPEGSKVPFLQDLGIFTEEGRVVRKKYDKYRQINRFLEFIDDIIPELDCQKELRIIDFGCGKSYLTFAMYYFLKELKGFQVQIIGLDLKEDVIQHCNELKRRYEYEGLKFLQGDIASYQEDGPVDMVVTLHACDTATDAALAKAVQWNARVVLSVPCCQHELNRQIQNEMLRPVLKFGLVKERVAALVTDAIRADVLELKGYQVQLLEFIDMEHTPKNILIRAVKSKRLPNTKITAARRRELEQCIQELHLSPALCRLLKEPVDNNEY